MDTQLIASLVMQVTVLCYISYIYCDLFYYPCRDSFLRDMAHPWATSTLLRFHSNQLIGDWCSALVSHGLDCQQPLFLVIRPRRAIPALAFSPLMFPGNLSAARRSKPPSRQSASRLRLSSHSQCTRRGHVMCGRGIKTGAELKRSSGRRAFQF